MPPTLPERFERAPFRAGPSVPLRVGAERIGRRQVRLAAGTAALVLHLSSVDALSVLRESHAR